MSQTSYHFVSWRNSKLQVVQLFLKFSQSLVLAHLIGLRHACNLYRGAQFKYMPGKHTSQGERVIVSNACITEGLNWLLEHEPKFSLAVDLTGPLPLRLRQDGFARLLGAIVSQQLSVASADAIWNRLEDAKMILPSSIKAAGDEDLRSCGLSRQKIRYARALAEANVDFSSLREMKTRNVIQALTKISGIGVWTAEIYAMFSLGRADVFAPGDLALKESVKFLFELEKRPSEKELRMKSEKWSPWRAVAARLLWAYYSHIKSREGIR